MTSARRRARLPEPRTLISGLADAPRRLDDVVSRLDAPAKSGLDDCLHNQPAQSRIANTTIVVIAISLTGVAILCYRWWH
jgi:hypothetical protein